MFLNFILPLEKRLKYLLTTQILYYYQHWMKNEVLLLRDFSRKYAVVWSLIQITKENFICHPVQSFSIEKRNIEPDISKRNPFCEYVYLWKDCVCAYPVANTCYKSIKIRYRNVTLPLRETVCFLNNNLSKTQKQEKTIFLGTKLNMSYGNSL